MEFILQILFEILIVVDDPFKLDHDGGFHARQNILGIVSFTLNIAFFIAFAALFFGQILITTQLDGTGITGAGLLILLIVIAVYFARNIIIYTVQLRATLRGERGPGRHSRH
jgi:hypothetical protein